MDSLFLPQLEIGGTHDTSIVLILDVLARIVRSVNSNDDADERLYNYDRQGQNLVLIFRTLPPSNTTTTTTTPTTNNAIETFRGLEYCFAQYTIFRVLTSSSSGGSTDDGHQVHEDSTQPNFVARGLELSGNIQTTPMNPSPNLLN